MSSNRMDSHFQRPFIDPTIEKLKPASVAHCQYLQSEDEEAMETEMSESGWTMYFDQYVDSRSEKYRTSDDDIEEKQKKSSIFTEDAKRYRIYDGHASSITGREEESSLVSDASSGPQKLPLTVQDIIEYEKGRRTTGSYSSVAIRKPDVHVNKDADSECIASCSLADVAPRKNKFRRLTEDEHDDLLLEDTANSPMHSLEEEAVNKR